MMELEYILEINPTPNDSVSKSGGYEYIIEVEKFNPYHDRLGRFTTAGGARIQADAAPGRPNKDFDADSINGNQSRDIAANKLTEIGYIGEPMGIEEALEGVNPRFNEGEQYQVNCQRCVQVYEMRRRGIDVSAASAPTILNKVAWGVECFTKTGSKVEARQAFRFGLKRDELLRKLELAPEGARYVVHVVWDNGGAHVFIAEKLKEGLIFVDPQIGLKHCYNNLYGVKERGFGLCRIDNKPLTANISTIKNTIEVNRK